MRTRFLVAVLAVALGMGFAPGLASANPDIENYWSPTDYRLGADDMAAWRTTMSASGKGVVFSGGRYRDYDATSGRWGPWKRLHVDPQRLRSHGNARGDVCTAWSADFGVAIACRPAGTRTWPKTNITTTEGAEIYELTVSTDGKRALVVWGEERGGRVNARASIYTLGNQSVRTTNLRGIPDRALQYYATPTRLGRMHGFALAVRTGRDALYGDATYLRLYRPGTGWSAQERLRIGDPAVPVLMSSMASDGIRTYAAVTPDIPPRPGDRPTTWWAVELRPNGTFTRPEPVPGPLLWPLVAASRTSVTLAGVDVSANNALVISRSTDFIDSPFRAETIPSPRVADTEGFVTQFALVGQRDASGDDGYALIAQYTGVSDPGEEFETDVDQLYTMTGFDVVGRSPLARLGNLSGYEGMGPTLTGYGRYAMTAYASGLEIYASVRAPVPL